MSKENIINDINVSREALSGTVAKVVMTVAGLLGTIILARILGPNGFGGFYLLFSISTIATRPLVGWSIAAKKRFSEQISEQRRSEILGSGFLFAGILSMILFSAASLSSDWLTDYVGVNRAPSLLVLLAGMSGIGAMMRIITQGRGKVAVSIWADTLQSVIAAPAQLIFILFGFGVAGMVFGHVFALLMVCPIFLYYINVLPSLPSKDTLSSLWSFARYSIPNAFVGKVYNEFDILLLGALLTPSAAGYYEAAFRVSAPALFVSLAAGSILFTRISNAGSEGIIPTNEIRNTISYASLLAFPLFFGALSLSNQVVTTIYGADFKSAGPLLIGLALYQLFNSHSHILIQVSNGWDRPDVVTRLSLLALGTNIVLGVILTMKFGPIGVVISTIIAEVFRYGGLIRFTSSRLSWSVLFPRPVFEQLVAGILMYGMIMVSLEVITITSFIHLIAVVGMGAATYFVILFLISVSHRQTALSALKTV